MITPSYAESKTIPSSYLQSHTLTKLVNPQCFTHNSISDTRVVTISDPTITRLSDEQILARYVRGYYGGWAFFPERVLLSTMKMCFGITLPSAFPGIQHGEDITSLPKDLSRDNLPRVGTTLTYGTFQVLASHIKSSVGIYNTPSTVDGQAGEDEQSYIDIAAGRATGHFTACHRYAIHRISRDRPEAYETRSEINQEDTQGKKDDTIVQIIQSDTALNPSSDSLGVIHWIHPLHMVYARLLHWDGVREVLRK